MCCIYRERSLSPYSRASSDIVVRIHYLLRHITRTGEKIQRLPRKRRLHWILAEEHVVKVLGSPEVVVHWQVEHTCLLITSTFPAPWGVTSAFS